MTNTFVFCIIELDENENEAESQTESLHWLNTTARKQSLLPIGNIFITLLHIRSNMTNTCVFCIRVWWGRRRRRKRWSWNKLIFQQWWWRWRRLWRIWGQINAFSSFLNNKKSVAIPDNKGNVEIGSTIRHHMIGYSIVSDKSSCTGAIKINLY